MVVLTNTGNVTGSNDNEELLDFLLIEERRCTSLPSSPAKQRFSPSKRKQYFINQAIRNSDLTPRAKGKKSLRRQENTRYLANLLEKEECTKDEVELCQSNPAIPTIFSQACTNGNYVEPWNDFMNRTGEEQEKLLVLLEEEAKKKSSSNDIKDSRQVHPAFSAQDCYDRIDRRLRLALRRKNIPLGTLESLEENLLNFFGVQPNSVYTTNLGSSFERLLLHAVCQYMDLVSASSDCKGARQTEVTNKQKLFQPPSPLLSAYLEQMS